MGEILEHLVDFYGKSTGKHTFKHDICYLTATWNIIGRSPPTRWLDSTSHDMWIHSSKWLKVLKPQRIDGWSCNVVKPGGGFKVFFLFFHIL